jgi:hypothetical protein
MATPKQLVKVVAESLGVSEATVTVHDRNLLLGGLRSAGKRGRGVAHVTAEDAANLLMAVAGSRNVKDSVKTVNEHGRLFGPFGWDWEKDEVIISRQKYELLPLPELDITNWHSFRRAIVVLLESAASGSLERVASETVGEQVDLLSSDQKLHIVVTLKAPLRFNVINIWHKDKRETHVYAGRRVARVEVLDSKEGFNLAPSHELRRAEPIPESPKTDLFYETSFTHRTIMKIGELLRQ